MLLEIDFTSKQLFEHLTIELVLITIKTGGVVIKRPDRHSYTDRDIALKDVKYVGGTDVRYQREQTRLRWAKLRDVLSEDDILGNKSVEYFMEKWDELVETYN